MRRDRAPRSIAADPRHKAEFERNADAYLAELRALDAGIASCIDSVPAAERKLVTDHDAFGYFADRYGIEVVGAVIPSQTTQAQASAKDLSELARTIEAEGVTRGLPGELAEPEGGRGDRRARPAPRPTTRSTATRSGPADSDGATYLQMEAANADAMVARLHRRERRGAGSKP